MSKPDFNETDFDDLDCSNECECWEHIYVTLNGCADALERGESIDPDVLRQAVDIIDQKRSAEA